MDSRTRQGWFGVQFEQLVEGECAHTIAIQTDAATLELTRFGNVVSCVCHLPETTPERLAALARRGAVDATFMISHKLAPRDFGLWLDHLLTDDLGAGEDLEPRLLELAAAR